MNGASTSIERLLIHGAATSDAFLKKLSALEPLPLIDNAVLRAILTLCLDFYRDHAEAPNGQFADLWSIRREELEQRGEDAAKLELIDQCLGNVGQGVFNVEFALAETEKYLRTKRLNRLLRDARTALDGGDLDATETLIAGYRPVSLNASAEPVMEEPWPVLGEDALYGLAGRIVRLADPHTEADPVATLGHFLVATGNLIGPDLYAKVQHDQHPARLNAVLVGGSGSAGRKGTSSSTPQYILSQIDPHWARERVKSGLSSGEGVIYHVTQQGTAPDGTPADGRLFIREPELATVLKRMSGEGNTLSAIIREAWDSGSLATLTRNNSLQVSGAHVSLLCHITKPELLRYLAETERANGFANRFLWLLVKRSKNLPDGDPMPEQRLRWIVSKLRSVATFAKGLGEVRRDEAARELWHEVYPHLTGERPGMWGAVTSRAEAQTLRLSVLYAALDCSQTIRVPHLKAALALWKYAEASARFIFGDATGDSVADRLLSALRTQGPMAETDIYASLFRSNVKADRIQRALEMLARFGLVMSEVTKTSGRPRTVWQVKGSR